MDIKYLVLENYSFERTHKNWRPITLLNSDYALLTKALAARLQKVLKNLVHPDKSGYIKADTSVQTSIYYKHYIINIRAITDIIEFTQKSGIGGIILLVDFEKAFDSVRWSFNQKLAEFSFGENFIKWINAIYTNPESSVLNNGFTTAKFTPQGGIRQGCPFFTIVVYSGRGASRLTHMLKTRYKRYNNTSEQASKANNVSR